MAHTRWIGLRGPSWADHIENEKETRGAEVARTVVEECGFLRIISHSVNVAVPLLRLIVKNLPWKRQKMAGATSQVSACSPDAEGH